MATTRAQSTTDEIRALILSGELEAGARLQAQKLADRLGVSRTPVVDALTSLHKEGLLQYAPHRGYSVKAFGLSDLLDAFDVRMTLEGLACRVVAERGLSAEATQALEGNLAETEVLLFGPEWSHAVQDEWMRLNYVFHDLFLTAANNAYLTAGVLGTRAVPLVHDAEMRPIPRSDFTRLYRREQSQQAFRDHQRIAEAICAGQSGRAENMMREHIFTNREAIRRHLQPRFGSEGLDRLELGEEPDA
jgi:GntR family transcriptional regulator, vanillate catabolism transcriptional regulator